MGCAGLIAVAWLLWHFGAPGWVVLAFVLVGVFVDGGRLDGGKDRD